MMVRTEVFRDVGLMDASYFLYFEEVDFCLAAQRSGWECHYVPASRVVHLVGQASGVTTPDSTKRRPGYWFESRRRYFCKNHGGAYAICADLTWIAAFAAWRLRRLLQRSPDTDPPHLLGDFIRHSTLVKPHDHRFDETPVGSLPHPDGLLAQLAEDWVAHDRDCSRPGFRAVAVHRIGNWRLRFRNKLLRAPFSLVHRFLFRRVRNRYGIELPYSVKLGRRVVIEHQGAIVIHGSSVIGDDCTLRQGVTLGIRSRDQLTDAPVLGNHVDVGAGAKILGSVKVGDHARIGANAVVLRDVPPEARAVGVPARIIPPRPWPVDEPET
jgi:serine O-acetyltransferase